MSSFVHLSCGFGGFNRKPVCCGVTSLGMDHLSTLGGTLESIAWQKAGIFKVPVHVPALDGIQAYI